ncbi:hypothetical protein K440DRAFT_99628 [Wilcoxina mikolae CBS 423.85]|nr:hypothetical protein K440DRAFT_99628 [Wilcoxina mikolae CBS 423.85]
MMGSGVFVFFFLFFFIHRYDEGRITFNALHHFPCQFFFGFFFSGEAGCFYLSTGVFSFFLHILLSFCLTTRTNGWMGWGHYCTKYGLYI